MSALTLYALEDNLLALLETAEGGIAPEQEAAFVAEFGKALAATKDKRDSVGAFLAHCDAMMATADAEIERLAARKQAFKNAKERLERYVVDVIRSLPLDEKGRYKKLEGITTTLGVWRKPTSVEVSNEAEVPDMYKIAYLSVNKSALDVALSSLDGQMRARLEGAMRIKEVTVSKSAIRRDLDAGDVVPGADYAPDSYRLVRS